VAIPQIIFYDQFNSSKAICMTALNGFPLSHYIGKLDDSFIVRLYKKALKQLHRIVVD